MPVEMDGGRKAGEWGRNGGSAHGLSAEKGTAEWNQGLRIALINNMPDSALEDTENQFFELLNHAAGDRHINVQLFSLPKIERGERGEQRLSAYYRDISELWKTRFDAAIITGTEPHQPNLRDEPYWPMFAEVLDWAERNTASVVLSCLAAHASVLHCEGIERRPLKSKQSGVFSYQTSEHALTSGIGKFVQFPHSRWNEVGEDDLTACGYKVLTRSVEAGVDSFVKKKKRSLFLHFQGHPEYSLLTLLKEYRRDIKRFIRNERETYPSMPTGYFDECSARLMHDFEQSVLKSPNEEQMAFFPEAMAVERLQNSWRSSAIAVYSNWLMYLHLQKMNRRGFVALTGEHPEGAHEQIA
jgi:homoserine O-succinyltransferase